MNETALWARVMKNHRIVKQVTVAATHDDVMEALNTVCYQLDLGRPLWLDNNQREWDDFSQTRFTKDHFMESIPFDRLEIEFINPKAPKKRSDDPRNG